MGRRSSIDQLPEPLRNAVSAAVKAGLTIDAIVTLLIAEGEDVSRSAVGRYTKKWKKLAERQRDIDTVAKNFAEEFGSSDNHQIKLLIQMMTSIITQAAIPIATGDEVDLGGKELADFARAVKDITSAAKSETDREAKIREEERKKAITEASQTAEKAARGAGVSDAAIEIIRKKVLGMR